ncbi:MAG: bifunctional oligoribonuclease/PAP phosphatase NrnA [Christensenellaceae bacterium]|nr:bifunctional oligoribonuclease/PAP phosphatase NrnA [Christensenellaceae bacterium]
MRPMEEIIEAIHRAETVAVVSHVNPDGDTIGSALALKLGLDKLGKRTALFCQDRVPDRIAFLRDAGAYRRPENAGDGRYDLLICVDVADEHRMGRCQCLTERCARSIQIDHHGTNPNYAEMNCVDAKAPATALVIHELLERLSVPMDADIAACLYVAISTDTGNFAFASTNPETFRVMAELMEAGLPLSELNRRLYRQREIPQVLLTQRCLSSLTFHHGGDITTMTLSKQDFTDCGAMAEHADTLVNYGLDILGVRMTALLRETSVPGEVKLSLRAVEPASVSGVAKHFGGGGHAQASGATVKGSLDEWLPRCVEAMAKALETGE